MKLTNKRGFSDAVYRATLKYDEEYQAEARSWEFSVTELPMPSRAYALKKLRGDELEEDVADRIWTLWGSALHRVLEDANVVGVSERRLVFRCGDTTIGFKPDTINIVDGILSDYKFQTVWSWIGHKKGERDEWHKQLNCYRYGLAQNGISIKEMRVEFFSRDWRRSESLRIPDYPGKGDIYQVPMIPDAELEAWIMERVNSHRAALKELPQCTDKERLAKPNIWAVHKVGVQRAVNGGLCGSEVEATRLVEKLGGESKFGVEFRKGLSVRCQEYCPVRAICDQYQAELKEREAEYAEAETS
jgi:hypothetical protein